MIVRRAPQSPALPLIYLVVAALAFVLAAAALPALAPALAGHYYHPRVLALVHTLTLGWITLTIMGASYQLMPILLEVAVASERLARWQLPIYVAGVIGIVGHFWIAEWTGFAWSAALVAVSILAHVANTAGAIARARPSFTARMMGVALAGLALTALFGTTLGADRLWRFLPTPFFATLHAHVQLALLGFVLPMVAGVAARVYPMFLLAPEPAGAGAAVQVLGIVGGVPVLVIGLLLGSHPAVVAGSVLVATAVVVHVHWVLGMTRAAKRPALDWSLRFVVAGALALVPTTVLGLGMALDLGGGPRMAVTYGVLAIGGWASLTIVGMLLKIVPFLVWYRVYGPRAGREPVPMLAELSWPAAEAVAFWLLTLGIAALAASVAVGDVVPIRIASAVVAAGALAFGATLAAVLRHLARDPVGTAVPKASGLTVGHR